MKETTEKGVLCKCKGYHEGWIIFFAIICPFGLIAYALYKHLKEMKTIILVIFAIMLAGTCKAQDFNFGCPNLITLTTE